MLPSGGVLAISKTPESRDFKSALVSLVIPMYNESEGLDGLFSAIGKTMAIHGITYEIICIDDGSTDGTFSALINSGHKRIRAYRLSRNYGKEIALSAGLDLAQGEIVIPMDADLQEPPELIPQMLQKWQQGFDVVIAIRSSRKTDGLAKATSAKLFYKFFNYISASKIPENAGDFRLMDRHVVDVLKQMPERNRFMKGLLSWPGFRCTQIEFERPERLCGQSKWKPIKLVSLAVDGLTSFSILPLRIASLLGSCMSLGAFIYGAFVICKRLFLGDPVQGYASLMTSMLFLGGVQLLALGIVGEYIGRIYLETKRRPLYVVMDSNDKQPTQNKTYNTQA